MYRGSLGWALRQLGRVLNDRNADGSISLYLGSTTSKIGIQRAVAALDDAQQQIFYDLLDADANREMLAREVPLTAVSGDTISYSVTPRTIEVWGLRDSLMDTDDDPLMAIHGTDYAEVGYSMGPRGETIKFHNWIPDASLTYYLRVSEEPASLTYGGFLQAESGSTVALLADTAEYGDLVLGDDEYNGMQLVVESGTTGKGLKRDITDWANAGDTTTASLGSSWTISDDAKYSIGFTLPRAAHQLIILKAATYAAHWVYKDQIDILENRFNRAWASAIDRLRKMSNDSYPKPWIVRSY